MAKLFDLYTTPSSRPASAVAEYELRLRLGAIRVRRDAADHARRLACDAHLAGELGKAYGLHIEADRHEDAITQYLLEIVSIDVEEPLKLRGFRLPRNAKALL